MKLTKAKIDEAQAVLLEMSRVLNGQVKISIDESYEYPFYLEIFSRDTMDFIVPTYNCDGEKGYDLWDSLHDAYIAALHEKAGTTPPPF